MKNKFWWWMAQGRLGNQWTCMMDPFIFDINYCNWYRNFPFISDPLFIYHLFISFSLLYWIQMIFELVDIKSPALACNYCVSMHTRTSNARSKQFDLVRTPSIKLIYYGLRVYLFMDIHLVNDKNANFENEIDNNNTNRNGWTKNESRNE